MAYRNLPAASNPFLIGSDAIAPIGLTDASLMTTALLPSPLEDERCNPSFSVRAMTFYLDGGEKCTLIREKMMLQLERDPYFKVDDYHELSRSQIRERMMLRAPSIAHYVTTETVDLFRLRLNFVSLVDPAFMTRIGVHYALFLGTLTNSGTPEQVAHWLGKGALTLQGLIGCFAMTEMGHGSNVAGIETTATFDPSSDEFVIHTPSLTATKWWIGGAAETASHSSVFAQMIVNGKAYGVKSFIVQLRDPKTFETLPGIAIGDCGAKMGRNGIDNGWIQFTNVRIPRSHLLMRHTKVSRDGHVKEPPYAQLTYGALIIGRVTMIKESADVTKKALMIAVRYSAVRRQFASAPGRPENKILDYKTHQQRLFPIIASAYAMHFGADEVTHIFDQLMSKLEIAKPGDVSMKEAIEALKETHATSAGLKAYSTWYAVYAIEACRQACGGHGYSSYAALSSMYQDYLVQCTWEGDNTVLTLQAGRYLISCYRDIKAGKKLPSGVSYLNDMTKYLSLSFAESATIDVAAISDGFNVVRCHLVQSVGRKYESLLSTGLGEDAAYEECSIQRFNVAKIHCIGYLFQRFVDGVAKASSDLQPILGRLCLLYGLFNVQENAGLFLQYGYFNSAQIETIQETILDLYTLLRPDAVPLVDAFNYSDYIVNSPLGRYDGDVYRRYFELVNARNPIKKPYYFDTILKPLLNPDKNIDVERFELSTDEPEA